MFYSSFLFHLLWIVKVAFVNALLRDTLSARVKSLSRNIGFMIIVRSFFGPFTHSDDEKLRQALEAVIKLLPNIRWVELSSSALVGCEVSAYQVTEVVNPAIRIASPLRGISGLVLQRASNENAQRMCILREVREAFGCL